MHRLPPSHGMHGSPQIPNQIIIYNYHYKNFKRYNVICSKQFSFDSNAYRCNHVHRSVFFDKVLCMEHEAFHVNIQLHKFFHKRDHTEAPCDTFVHKLMIHHFSSCLHIWSSIHGRKQTTLMN